MPQKLQCEVQEIIDHDEHVYSLFLKPEKPLPHSQPGQFLHLALDEYRPGDFWPDSRAFSIASPSNEKDLLRITYAVKGAFTGRMERELEVGRVVWIKLPYGDFQIDLNQPACLIAGGTGITAFSAFLSELEADKGHSIFLLYGARKPHLLIYRPVVESALTRCSNLQAWYFIEQGAGVNGLISGQIDLSIIWDALQDKEITQFYLSGPKGMLQTFSRELVGEGILPNQIHLDAWE